MHTVNKSTIFSSSATASHNRTLPKPNEDRIFIDQSQGLFILLDGITRVHDEYFDAPYKSAACEINEIFIHGICDYFDQYADAEQDIESLLREAVRYGNSQIAHYRSQKALEDWGFYPGTVGIVAYIHNNQLHYIYAGDCIGILLRNNAKICFGEQYAVAACDFLNPSKQERYSKYCNHPENTWSYTIFNGDDIVADWCEYAYIDLHKEDVILLASDGIRSYVRFEKPNVLKELSVEAMLDASEIYDVSPFAPYADDKAIIKILF